MGVRGLKSFIENHPALLEDHNLRDTKVIIDGNNLYHVLYYCFRVPYRFGGDYDSFAKKCRQYFQKLISCKISPYVIFDGGYEKDDRKLETTLQRAKERIYLGGFISHGLRGAKILPILTYETFRNVLTELHIPHATCQFEADEEIAALASRWSCPVMSNDSDFFIFDLPGGFIPLDYMNVDVFATSEENLTVKIYFIDKFSKMFNVDKDRLPLLASVIGNDYVDSKLFEGFFMQLKLLHGKKKKKNFVSKSNERISVLLTWLGSLESCQTGIEELLQATKTKIRDFVKSSIETSIEMYVRFKRDSCLIRYFCNEPAMGLETEVGTSVLHSYSGSTLPSWFCLALQQSKIPVFLQNAILLHRVILLCQVENMSLPSAYKCSQFLREVIYGILIGEDCALQESSNKPSKHTHVVEYDRSEKNICKNFVKPLYSIPGMESLPNLNSLPDTSSFQRINIIKHVLQTSDLCDMSTELFLLCGVIKFWILHATPKVTCNHMRSVMMYILLVKIEKEESKSDKCENDTEFTAALNSSSKEQIDTVKKNLSKYFRKVECNSKNPIDKEMIHGFSQFQTCLMDTIYLNQLLLSPCPVLEPVHVFSGTFLYNFCKDLNHRTNVPLFIAEMLVKHSPLLELFTTFEKIILDNLEMNVFASSSLVAKKRTRRKNTARAPTNKIVDAENGSSCGSDDETRDPRGNIEAACDISNRFSTLTVD